MQNLSKDYAKIILLAYCLSSPVHAVPVTPLETSKTGTFVGTNILNIVDSQTKSYNYKVSPSSGYLVTGITGESKINFNSLGGAAFGVYGYAEGIGTGGGGINDIVGVHGTAKKSGAFWAAGVHADCYDVTAGGFCIGVNVEFPQVTNQSTLIGVNIQPASNATNVVGIQLQNPQTYSYGIDAANTQIKFGDVNGTPFCMKFNPTLQILEFWRGCSIPGATRVGYINMNFGSPNTQINH